MDILGLDTLSIDILGGDRPAPNDDLTEQDIAAADGEYDLWDLNRCVVQDACHLGDVTLCDRVLAHWDKMLSNT